MTAQWVDTETDEEARSLDRGMWEVVGRHKPDGSFVAQATGPAPENGEFWADALDRIKDDPDQRYAMARRHLPLPAAWREMAIALRTKIRKARKEKTDYEDLLRELHHLAAMWSYTDYGYIGRIPYARLASLDLAYHRIGNERLPLLGATDRKWMKELWGEPSNHSTASELYEDMLAADIERIKADRKREDDERMDLLFGELSSNTRVESRPDPQPYTPKRRGLLGWLFGR
ncbi:MULTISPECIES: hypothetical protein [Rhizobium]|uniref:hypothetical protein n=1 Tax=Rhizobium TaxID=379 RepID=UPI0007EB6486|nr:MULTISPECIES: hypothetical protein [Rhizobium]ANK92737.1 hypothetical protein AMK01_CH03314 [Rhizobium sp. N6212]ANK98782.1 hypothetical protein AMK00_CH03318 [Rhizobium sp. N621]ANL04910.1 hypothetical protein AMJ99_CH03394 [Rhizobium esperanzae]ANL10969.1 hypothetical protein AMJ98_CH03345 [Rhizobium sp. N1341]ANL23021.1 hypothetical protein AMJ96_CH03345 [Rhizobium sp. N113]